MEWEKQEGTELWLPTEEGETLQGEVISVNDSGEYGRQLTIKKEDGEEIKTPSHKVLQSRTAKIKMGDIIRIKYVGTEAPSVKGYSPTKMYEVDRAKE